MLQSPQNSNLDWSIVVRDWSIVVNPFRPPTSHIPPREVRSLSERRARADRAGAAPGRRLEGHRWVALRATQPDDLDVVKW